jgi:ribosome-associated protein
MDIKKLQTIVVSALEDIKGQDIALFDTTHLTSLFDRIAIVSGTSNRQTKALAASVRDKVKEAGGDVVGMEGEETGEWVLVDLGDMIVHIMQAPIRAYYRLEEIWGDKPVKLGAAKRKSTKEALEAAPKKTSSHLAAGKKEKAAEPVIEKKVAARKPGVPKPAASKVKAAEGDVVAKKPAARKSAAKKVVEPVIPEGMVVPEGKKVKVSATKTLTASTKANREEKAKSAAKAKAAAEAPAKTVIKRIRKAAAE